MSRQDLEKLLGGYATGTLTAAERQALFSAALEDQALFETIMAEEPLRELFGDPAARDQLLAALEETPEPWYCRDVHPGLIAAVVASVVIAVVAVKYWPVRTAPSITVVARNELPQPTKSLLPNELTPLPKMPVLPRAPVVPSSVPRAVMQPAVTALLAGNSEQSAPPSPSVVAPRPAAQREALMRAAVQPAPLAVRYSILKKLPGGGLDPLDPQVELDGGEEIVIRLVPNTSGFLYVMDRSAQNGSQLVFSSPVEAGGTYDVPPGGAFRAQQAGPREFVVMLARQPQNLLAVDSPAVSLTRARKADGAVNSFAANTTGGFADIVSIPITLKYK
jgi:hypothetical protein